MEHRAGYRGFDQIHRADSHQPAATTPYRSHLPALTGRHGRPRGWPGSTKPYRVSPGPPTRRRGGARLRITGSRLGSHSVWTPIRPAPTMTGSRRAARNWSRVTSRSPGSGRLQGMTGKQLFEAFVSAHGGAGLRPPLRRSRGTRQYGKESPVNTDDVSRDLARAFPEAPGDLSRLHDRLAAVSQRDGILDVAYRILDSPVGSLLLAGTEQGLVRVAYAREDHDAVLQALADKVSPRILHAPARLGPAARELEEYFAGRRRAFDLPL